MNPQNDFGYERHYAFLTLQISNAAGRGDYALMKKFKYLQSVLRKSARQRLNRVDIQGIYSGVES